MISKTTKAGPPLILSLVFIAVFASVVVATYLYIVGISPLRTDPVTYAEPGRQILQGKGFVSRRINVAYLPLLSDLEDRPLLVPYMDRPLLQPWYNALVFALFGANEWSVAWSNLPLFIGLLLTVFLLTRELFDDWAGYLAVLLCLFEPTLLFISTFGMSDIGFMLAVVLAFYGLVRGAKSGSWKPLIAGSLAIGVSQYARPVGFVYLVPLAVFLFLTQENRRVAKIALLVALYFLLTFPIGFRSWYLFGRWNIHGVHLLLYLTPSFPGLSTYFTLDIPQSVWAVASHYWWQIARKWLKWMFAHVVFLFRMTNPATVVAAILGGLWLGPTSRLVASFGWSVLLAFGLTAATQSLVNWSARHVSHLFPLLAVLASGAFVAAWRQWAEKLRPISRGILAFAGVILILNPLATRLHLLYKGKAAKAESIKTYRAFGTFIMQHVGPEEIVATDLTPQVMWYGQRTSLTLPVDIETARRVREEYVNFKAIILTSERITNSYFIRDEIWRKAYRGEAEPLGFAIDSTFDRGGFRAVLLRPKVGIDEPRSPPDAKGRNPS